ncbi:hypothetical protein [Neobacillus sp. SuZ13]|uniref:hypothetical protein n=1 Tax=Neobacillus sp. SuZ13 TaxID=3047875 RepID=UPI0024C02C2F|nr:hypothetical protein [Neobacillus sp. SuZ13]WHY66047.1 hypothetical protein QNH17_23625 [Neobacillus sp. SuZ13]
MKKYLLIVSTFLTFLCPSHSFAEDTNILRMEELSIQVMPEFAYHPNDHQKDHVPLLIGYQGTMVNNSSQPQTGRIEIPLPMKDKDFRIGYVADYSSNFSKTYEIEYINDLEKGTISWTTSEVIAPNERYKFVIEFYSDGIHVKKDVKSLQYQFKSFADINLVNVTFTEPSGAKNVKLIPASDKAQNHGSEENTHSYLFHDVKAGEVKTFTLFYTRSESKPTSELMNAQSIEKTTDYKPTNLAIGAISGIGVLSVGALTFLIRKRKR